MNMSFENRFHLTIDLLRNKHIIICDSTQCETKKVRFASLMWSNHRKEKLGDGWDNFDINIFNNK